MSDDDLILFADSLTTLSDAVHEEIIRAYQGARAIRSFRTLGDALADAQADAEGGEVTVEILREVFAGQRSVGKR